MAEPRTTPVRAEIRDGVGILTLDHPPLNVVHRALTEALEAHLDAWAADRAVRCLIVTGAGERAFCAGSDIAEFAGWLEPGRIVPEKLAPQHRAFGKLDDFPKPTIAAVNGLAFGGGLEIAVCCDLVVADETAKFALPEIKLGVFPGSGGPVRIARRVGEGRAKELMFLGEPIDAATALAWGLVNRTAPRGGALDLALALAATLSRRPPLALSLCKTAIDLAFDASEDEAIAGALPLSDRAFLSPEAREGVRAFLAKTEPDFPDALHREDRT